MSRENKNVNIDESRRSFVKKIWKGLGLLAGIEIITVISAYLFSGRRKSNQKYSNNIIEAGPIEQFSKNSVTPFRGGRFYLSRLNDGGFLALSLKCTHLGCSINWEKENNRFVCPCHSSAFDVKGNVNNPPAPKALDYFPVFAENGIIKVDVGQKLSRDRFMKNQVYYI